jgi:hypothetical protein
MKKKFSSQEPLPGPPLHFDKLSVRGRETGLPRYFRNKFAFKFVEADFDEEIFYEVPTPEFGKNFPKF